MPYLVDGHNLLGRLAGAPGRQSPQALISILAGRLRANVLSVTVVFDGSPASGPTRLTLGRLRVVYASPASADDAIVDIVGRSGSPREWTVVTADRGLASRVRDCGARTMSLEEFEGRFAPESPEDRKSPAGSSVDDWAAYFSDERNRNLP